MKAKTDVYYNEGKRLYDKDLSAELTIRKQQPETVWLNEVSSVALQQELRHLDRAFIHFFEGRAEYPQFHKKHGKQSATFASSAFKWDGKTITLAKMKEPLNIRWSRKLSGIPTSLTITKDAANRYFVSLTLEEDITPLPEIDQQVGIDLGFWMRSFYPLGRKWEIRDTSARMRSDLPRLKNAYLKSKKAPRTATKPESK